MVEELIRLFGALPLLNSILSVCLLYLGNTILKEVRRTNGRLVKLETWQNYHEVADNDRFDDIKNSITQLMQMERNR